MRADLSWWRWARGAAPVATRLPGAALLAMLALLLVTAPRPAQAQAQAPLQVDARPALALWPAVALLFDPLGLERVETLAQQPARFARPTGTPGNLGRRDEVVWLRVVLAVPGGEPVRRVLEIDYPPLNSIDVYVVRDGELQSHQRLGNALRHVERPLATRTHAAPLTLAPGEQVLLLRVQTLSSLVLPITLRTPEAFAERESQVSLVQGIILGIALCMLIYSLSHWANLRDPLFGLYAAMLAGNLVFVLSFFGIGPQHLWPDWPALSLGVAPMAVMLTVAAGTAFMRSTLLVHEVSRPTDLALRFITAASLLVLMATLVGLMGYRSAQTMVTVLGLVATVLVLPVAFVRARRGERVAQCMLFGWVFYMVGAFTAAGLLRGFIQPTAWSQHVYPLTMIVEMTAWMAVLGLRVQAIHRNADRARLEADALRTLAHTDALTGLPNRRGLQARLETELRRCDPARVLALYLLDLDGFKAVNDRCGHDVGDALLVEVSRRLQSLVRHGDGVARLGGDEFVVLAAGLADEAAAQRLGHKLLAAFDLPFDAAGQRCEVGLTAGYALAPLDGTEAGELLKRADAAMYAGKQAGRHRVQRGGRVLASV